MGSGFVCATPAPQGPPKQVEGKMINKEENKVSKWRWIDKSNRQDLRWGVCSCFDLAKLSFRTVVCSVS